MDEMRACAAETLTFFVQAMPDVPFAEKDIVFAFAKKSEMANQALELCAQYCPEKILNESQLRQLGESIAANALIGRGKSAVLIRSDNKVGKMDFSRIVFHELMHIFCAKLEMDDTHFIDIYGSGTTPDIDPEDKTYDGMIVAGYSVWSEFIAQYYAVKMIDKKRHGFTEIAESVTRLFHDVHVDDLEGSKGAFSMICAYWLTCTDLDESLDALEKPGMFMPIEEPHGVETQEALFNCIDYLYKHMQNDKPWKISEDFIYGLGFRFSIFRLKTANILN